MTETNDAKTNDAKTTDAKTPGECLNDLQLDRLLADEAATDQQAARDHVAGCPACRERVALLRQMRDDSFDPEAAADRVEEMIQTGVDQPTLNMSRWIVPLLAVGVVGAVVVAVAMYTSLGSDSSVAAVDDSGARLEAQLTAGPALTVRAGAVRTSQLVLVLLGRRGPATVLQAEDGRTVFEVRPGEPQPVLARAPVEALAEEQLLVGFFCPQPPDPATLLDPLDEVFAPDARGGRLLETPPPATISGCALRSKLLSPFGMVP